MESNEMLRTLIADIEAELTATNARAERLSSELMELTAMRSQLSNEIGVLKRALARRGASINGQEQLLSPEALMEQRRGLSSAEARGMARTDVVAYAIEKLVEERGSAVGPSDVNDYLHRLGRDDRTEVVSAAMAHLKNSGRIHRVGQGQWLPGPENAETPARTGASVQDQPVRGGSLVEGDADESSESLQDHLGGPIRASDDGLVGYRASVVEAK